MRAFLYNRPMISVEARNREIVDETLELAEYLLMWKHNLTPENDVPLYDSNNAMAQDCWQTACEIQDMLTQTDVKNALDEIQGEQK